MTKFQFLITGAVSLLIAVSVAVVALHLLTGVAEGLAGQWQQYARL